MKAFAFILTIFLLGASVLPFGTTAQRKGRAAWPKQLGVFTATSSETIPLFPRTLSGYRPMRSGFSYWNEPFEADSSIRVGTDWVGIHDFPANMNNCSYGAFMIRWRNANPDVRIATMLANYHDVNERYPFRGNAAKVGRFGYMYGFNCVQPVFKVSHTINRNSSTIDDIYYELKFWRAAP
jgi:hypothetical protein